ncbi:MAG TPA: class II aldolase/adducin family protein [Anaerolineae bacterium]
MLQNEYSLRQEIVQIGRLMYEKGFISASDGNVSARLEPGRLLITPSGLHKGFLEPDQLLVVDEAGRVTGMRTAASRQLKPTSEMPMHLEAYRQRPDITAVVHAHPPITIALSIAGIPMAECLLPEVIVFLGLIPTTQYATPSSAENVRAIRDFIASHDAIVLQRHGSLTVGRSPMQAFMRLETMEQNARIAFMLAQLGVRNPLPPAEVEKLLRQRQQMGLSRPGEAAEFCGVCGVCHEGEEHAPTLRLSESASLRVGKFASGQVCEWASIPANPGAVRDLVAQIVHQTLGDQ